MTAGSRRRGGCCRSRAPRSSACPTPRSATSRSCSCRRCGPAPPRTCSTWSPPTAPRSEEHTSELQSRVDLVCRLLLEKKKNSGHLRLAWIKNGQPSQEGHIECYD